MYTVATGDVINYLSQCAAAIFLLLMVSMIPSRKRIIRNALPHERFWTHMRKLLMCSVFSAAVAAITPATTSAEAETIATTPKEKGYATDQLGKKHLGNRTYDNKYSGFRETPPPGYYGNWNFAPGGDYWNRNYLWRRSLGFWDTNSPACPFRSC
jgi:hypothetical protein